MLQNRFKKILVPLDGSANSIRGLNEAISLARQCGSTLTGIHVLPIFPTNLVGTSSVYRNYLTKKAIKFMEVAKTSAARNGVIFDMKITTSNDTVQKIVTSAKNNKFDLIVIGSRGQGVPNAQFLGSVANGVLLSSKIPVLIVK
jgi:nucleotide-binding universal stress UspA family protein